MRPFLRAGDLNAFVQLLLTEATQAVLLFPLPAAPPPKAGALDVAGGLEGLPFVYCDARWIEMFWKKIQTECTGVPRENQGRLPGGDNI